MAMAAAKFLAFVAKSLLVLFGPMAHSCLSQIGNSQLKRVSELLHMSVQLPIYEWCEFVDTQEGLNMSSLWSGQPHSCHATQREEARGAGRVSGKGQTRDSDTPLCSSL